MYNWNSWKFPTREQKQDQRMILIIFILRYRHLVMLFSLSLLYHSDIPLYLSSVWFYWLATYYNWTCVWDASTLLVDTLDTIECINRWWSSSWFDYGIVQTSQFLYFYSKCCQWLPTSIRYPAQGWSTIWGWLANWLAPWQSSFKWCHWFWSSWNEQLPLSGQMDSIERLCADSGQEVSTMCKVIR